MASRILVVVLVLVVLAAVGFAIWLATQPPTSTAAAPPSAAATVLNATALRQPLSAAPLREQELHVAVQQHVLGLLE